MAVAPSTGPNSEQSDIGLGRTLDICRRGSDVKTAFAVLGVQRTPRTRDRNSIMGKSSPNVFLFSMIACHTPFLQRGDMRRERNREKEREVQ